MQNRTNGWYRYGLACKYRLGPRRNTLLTCLMRCGSVILTYLTISIKHAIITTTWSLTSSCSLIYLHSRYDLEAMRENLTENIAQHEKKKKKGPDTSKNSLPAETARACASSDDRGAWWNIVRPKACSPVHKRKKVEPLTCYSLASHISTSEFNLRHSSRQSD